MISHTLVQDDKSCTADMSMSTVLTTAKMVTMMLMMIMVKQCHRQSGFIAGIAKLPKVMVMTTAIMIMIMVKTTMAILNDD